MPGPNSGDTERDPGPGTHGEHLGEFGAIERIAEVLSGPGPAPGAGELWIGDDTAVVAPPEGRLLFATDVAVMGVHADPRFLGAADLGWRAMVANVSDVAAMGGRPRYAVVAVAGPPDTALLELADGVAEAAGTYGCAVVGGDLSAARDLVVSVAIVGDTGGTEPVTRAGAGPGDRIFVTGPLGAAAAGLRVLRDGGPAHAELVAAHRRPRARVEEGRAAARAGVRAMIDVSDGLAADLGHLARASGVGIALDEVPVAAGATVEEALGGGEDYVLVMATPDPPALRAAFAAAGLPEPLAVGRCTADRDERSLAGRPLPVSGWTHAFDVGRNDGGRGRRQEGRT